ncbi:hypothetical protein AK812_SmicGene22554 [Symbiodinium microadriaticum]|uniref:Uncharacterized protein n=1 Tax=Symbiodinium microadriaticum TaxID=2951 RepID=A0A1Q9DJJ8_SYMMI|nr:hypothetical protein AK812_SmicGene22554 [Symbiodinium microadriaticum]
MFGGFRLELLDEMPLSELEPDSLTYGGPPGGMLLSECEQRGTSGKEIDEPDEDEEDEDELDEEFQAATPVTRSRRGAASQPIPCTSAMNAQRVKGRDFLLLLQARKHLMDWV